jgi:hypothetical protein
VNVHTGVVNAAVLVATVGCASAKLKLTEVVGYRLSSPMTRIYVIVDNRALISSQYARHFIKEHKVWPVPRLEAMFSELLVKNIADRLAAQGIAAKASVYSADAIADSVAFSADAILFVTLSNVGDWDDSGIYDAEYDVSLQAPQTGALLWRTHAKTSMNSQRRKGREDAMTRFSVALVEALKLAGAI